MSFITRLLIHIAATAAVFWALETHVFPGSFAVLGGGIERYAIVALLFGLLNTFVRPILKLVMLPVQFFTLGLAGLAVNGLLLIGLDQVLGFLEITSVNIMVDHWIMYFVIGFLLGIANTIIHWLR